VVVVKGKLVRLRERLDWLAIANIAFVAGIALHGTDHMRQARGLEGLTPEVLWAGIGLAVVAFATLPLTLSRHPQAPLVAAVVGLWTAIAVTAVHLGPDSGAFSDSYWHLSLDAYSWIVMLAEILTALTFGLVGIRELRRHARASLVEP
jgi:hypothetical protein